MNVKLGLFDRLPKDIFRPLASANRERYWALLLRLHESFFGPDAGLTPEDGYVQRTITYEIERFILDCDDWVTEDGQPLDTPISVRANMALERLVNAGWLREERIGVRTMIVMPPVVQKFLEQLQQFAEEGPKRVGGKVQLIYNSLLAIERAPKEQAGVLPEAAKEARNLVASLGGTSIRVREIMEALVQHETTGAFVAHFFKEYISSVYIQDYQEIRTNNHPLRHRHDIVRIATWLRDDAETRVVMLEEYRRLFSLSDLDDAAVHFERDIGRLLKFQQIQLLLDRLDDSVTRATRQALAFIQYRLRTPDRIEQAIENTIETLISDPASDKYILTPFAAGPLFSEEQLREPRKVRKDPVISPIRSAVMTPEQKALSDLRREMQRARQVTRQAIRNYLRENGPSEPGQSLSSEDLSIRTVNEFLIFQELSRASFLRERIPVAYHRSIPLLRDVEGYEFSLTGEVCVNEYLEVPQFKIQKARSR
ncbi:hypothetical protein FE848_17100 [Marinobacter sp. 1-3A]|uniref:Wadjet anti-phage system protein JetA family protein n=1 Tax=Marinobacter sp. 1-3A TaxID=2582920 RepID=UPI00190708C2|nr:Wadjet anti-phage system protein JetA family protein [Marinobacter sp. 1-3A]MBK1874944.1 hypothetical protein [Marinobacter sp. 1-3A]